MTQVAKHNPNQYFEGVLQIRNPNQKVMDFLLRYVKKYEKKNVYIAKEAKVKNGVDIYLSSKKFLRTISNKLYEEFGGIVSLNEHLFSQDKQTGRHIFRLNVLFKVPEFGKSDVIVFNKKLVLVKNVSKKVSGTDIVLNKKISFKYSDKVSVLDTYETTISKIKPSVEVLHPETYESVEVKNEKLRKLKLGEKVNIVLWKGIYIV
tara:strand:- start:24937 stop:25551 length:615 start_codon:yes stop_codon:yes gene_type:complete